MEERLVKLEVKIAYAEETIATLNQVVTDQDKEIALLKTRLEKLEQRLADLIALEQEGLPADQMPPHY